MNVDDNSCQLGVVWMWCSGLSSSFIRPCSSVLGSASSTGGQGFLRQGGVALFNFLLNSSYGRMAGRIWEAEKQCFFTEVGKYGSSVNEIGVKKHLLPRKYTVLET